MADYRPVRYRLSEEDRAKFGGPEWVTFDREKLFELDANYLVELEQSIGMTIGRFLAASMMGSALGTKAMIFLARKLDAGLKEDFAAFNPHIFKADSEPVGEEEAEDADPTPEKSDGSETAE